MAKTFQPDIIPFVERLAPTEQETVRKFYELVKQDKVVASLDIDGYPFHRLSSVGVSIQRDSVILWIHPVPLDIKDGKLVPYTT